MQHLRFPPSLLVPPLPLQPTDRWTTPHWQRCTAAAAAAGPRRQAGAATRLAARSEARSVGAHQIRVSVDSISVDASSRFLWARPGPGSSEALVGMAGLRAGCRPHPSPSTAHPDPDAPGSPARESFAAQAVWLRRRAGSRDGRFGRVCACGVCDRVAERWRRRGGVEIRRGGGEDGAAAAGGCTEAARIG